MATRTGTFQDRILMPFARRTVLVVTGLAFVVMVLAALGAGYQYVAAKQPPRYIQDINPAITDEDAFAVLERSASISVIYENIELSTVTPVEQRVARLESNEAGNALVSVDLIGGPGQDLFRSEPIENSFGLFAIYTNEEYWLHVGSLSGQERTPFLTQIQIQTIDERGLEGQWILQIAANDSSVRQQPPISSSVQVTPRAGDASGIIEVVAQQFAEAADPEISLQYFEVYTATVEAIRACPDSDAFATELRRLLVADQEQFGTPFAPVVIHRLCEPWQQAVGAAQAQERELAQQQRRLEAAYAAQISSSLLFLMISGGALFLFFVLIFPLSHLAMEDHLRAIRDHQKKAGGQL